MIAFVRGRFSATLWTLPLAMLASAVFMISFGTGLLTAANTNFFVDILKLSGTQVLWVQGLREIPGLALIFVAALIAQLPLIRRATYTVVLMGIGYALYSLVHSYIALVAVAIVASLGFHIWVPLQSALGLGLASKEHSGRVMGALASVAALASIVGMGGVALFAAVVPLRAFNAIGGAMMVIAGLIISRLPQDIGATDVAQPRMLMKRRYWLYYVLIFFEGARVQVFGAFGVLILVQEYLLGAREISLLLLASAAANFIVAPRMGALLDRLGERRVLPWAYVALAFCFVGYATARSAWMLGLFLIGINLLNLLSMGLSTYVRRIAPAEELAPTLTAGVSVNHITSVSVSLLAGTLLRVVGYQTLCWAAAGIILLSVPFALAMRTQAATLPEPLTVAGE